MSKNSDLKIKELEEKFNLTKKITKEDIIVSPWVRELTKTKNYKELKIQDITMDLRSLKLYLVEEKIEKLIDCIFWELFINKKINSEKVNQNYFKMHCDWQIFKNLFINLINNLTGENGILKDHIFIKYFNNDENKNELMSNVFQNYIYLGIKQRNKLTLRYSYNNRKIKKQGNADKKKTLTNILKEKDINKIEELIKQLPENYEYKERLLPEKIENYSKSINKNEELIKKLFSAYYEQIIKI